MDRGACQAIVQSVSKSQIQLKQLSMHVYLYYYIYITALKQTIF